MNVLIFGAKGQLGRDLIALFGANGEVGGYDLPEVDITALAQVAQAVATHRPDVVVNAAAYTDVEKAEDDEAKAFRVNVDGARNIARAAADDGLPVVYFSTDYVFGGTKRQPYEPDDPVAPIGVYARSKRNGEVATMEVNDQHFIIRTAWLYGAGGNNFVEKILRAAATRPELRVVNDEIGSPTFTRDLARATKHLCETTAYGAYHAVNAGACSRYEFAKEILALGGVTTPVVPCASSEFPTKAERPLYSVLSNEKLERATGFHMPSWQDALADYMTVRTASAHGA